MAVARPRGISFLRFFLRKPATVSLLPREFVSISLLQTSPVTTLTSKNPEDEQKRLSFTVRYLIDSCGLSPEYAIVAAPKLLFDSPKRPNTVLNLLRDHGFSRGQISRLVKKRPALLLADAETVLLPKFRFFLSIGISKSALARTLASAPTILTRSLVKHIIPSYNYLKTVLVADEKIVAALRRTTWILMEDHTKNLLPNINHMSDTGIPEKCVKLLLTHFPEAVMQKKEEFRSITKKAIEMGFNPKKSTFVMAIHALSGKGNKSIWDKCFEVYKSWDLSEDDIMFAFRKQPHCMMLSEKKINGAMKFLIKEMNWTPRMIAQYPSVLLFSLEKRIIPRCSVIKVLVSNGMVKENWCMTSFLIPVEKVFLDKFVIKYEKKLPELMDVYRRNTKTTQL